MQYTYLISLYLFLNICHSQDNLYTYERIQDSLYVWQDIFGGDNQHPSPDYNGFGVIYSLDSIGYSSQDMLPIYAVKLSANVNEREPEPKVLILGQCHAEEIYGVEIAMEIINQFLHPEAYPLSRPYLQWGLYSTELWIIPTYNPEGLRVVHGYFEDANEIKDVTYRKNKRDTNNDGIFDYIDGIGQDTDGVDLNRNYDFNWIFGDTLLQPCNPVISDCSYNDDYDYYKGEYPESESETQAIVNLAKQNFLLSIAYHSSRSGNVDKNVVYPWAWEGKGDIIVESPGFDVISYLGDEIATELLDFSYFGGSKSRRGNAHDWLYRETGCIQYLIEVGYTNDAPYGEGLLIESDHLDEVVASNMDAFFHLLMRAAGNNYNSVDGNQVRGIVRDNIDSTPIVNAVITIPELENNITRPRITDESGFYSRLLHPYGSYTMLVSAFGYQTTDTINITHSSSGATTHNIGLIPSQNYELDFYIDTPDNYNGNFQLIRHHILQSDTFLISSGETKSWPAGDYKLIINENRYMTNVIDIVLSDNMELYVDLLYEDIIWEENPSDTWNLMEELTIPLNNLSFGDSLMIEINFRYELEWDYDYFTIQYIDEDYTTDIIQYNGDNYQFHTEYIPFLIPEGHANGSFYLHLNLDETIEYRGVEIDYIKIMKGSESPLTNGTDISGILPSEFLLHQNYPNPFNPTSSIRFSIPHLSQVSISIYNIRGEFIEELENNMYGPGNYVISIDAKKYASGIYLYRMETENTVYTRKCTIIK